MLLFSNKLFSYFIPRDDGKLPLAGFLAEGKMATYKLILCKTPSSKMDFWLQISFFVVKFSFPKSKQVWLRIVNMEHNIMCHADVSRAKTTISTHFHFFSPSCFTQKCWAGGNPDWRAGGRVTNGRTVLRRKWRHTLNVIRYGVRVFLRKSS